MGMGFMHLIFGWFLGKVYEFKTKSELSLVEISLLMFGTVVPDADYLIDWVFGTHIHRLLTHSFLGVILGFILCYFLIKFLNRSLNKNYNAKKLSIFFSVGILSHIFLDMTFGWPGISLLYPYDKWFYFFGIENIHRSIGITNVAVGELLNELKLAILDIGLGVAFVFYH